MSQKTLLKWIGLVAIFEIAAFFMKELYQNNLPLYHLYTVVEFGAFTLIYHLGNPNLITRKQLIGFSLAFLFLAIINVIFFQRLLEFSSNTRSLESILLIIFALRYFWITMRELKVRHIEQSFLFWFNTAILLYFAANLLIFIYNNFLQSAGKEIFTQVYLIHSILNFFLYSLFSIALLCPLNTEQTT